MFSYGIGGLAYWLARRGALVCPNCGLTWHGAASGFGLERLAPARGRGGSFRRPRSEEALPSAGLKRRLLGIVMVLIASVVIVAGIVDFEAATIAAGSALGVGGTGTFLWGRRVLQERRAALAQFMERRVLQLASRRGGTLTVTEVAAGLDLSLPAAERILAVMDDGFRVRSDVTDEGILLYEFPEVRHRPALESPDS